MLLSVKFTLEPYTLPDSDTSWTDTWPDSNQFYSSETREPVKPQSPETISQPQKLKRSPTELFLSTLSQPLCHCRRTLNPWSRKRVVKLSDLLLIRLWFISSMIWICLSSIIMELSLRSLFWVTLWIMDQFSIETNWKRGNICKIFCSWELWTPKQDLSSSTQGCRDISPPSPCSLLMV